MLSGALAVLIVVGATEPKVEQGLAEIKKTISAVRGDSGACKKSTLSGLKDARDALEAMRAQANTKVWLKARRSVEDVLDGDTSGCNAATKTQMQKLLESLSGTVQEKRAAAAAPSPHEKKLMEKRQCWNFRNDWSKVDPGCHVQKNGNYALDKDAFGKLLGAIRAKGGRFERAQVVEEKLGYGFNGYLTSMQLAEVIRALLDDVDRLEAVKRVAKRVVDPQNAGHVTRQFSQPMMRSDAQDAFTQYN